MRLKLQLFNSLFYFDFLHIYLRLVYFALLFKVFLLFIHFINTVRLRDQFCQEMVLLVLFVPLG